MPQASPNYYLFNTKEHYGILDGLRGVAALAVVVFHFMEFVVPDYHKNFIAHAYLAVDFFFCLSGFVIAYAYDNRIKELGTVSFFKLRLIRLHPLVIIGSVIGLLAFVFDPFSNLDDKYGNVNTWIMFITSCFLIPFPLVRERYFNNFHLNPPTWSLFWEYIANIFYVLILYRLRKNILWVLAVVAAGLLFYEAGRSGNLAVGWSGDNIMGGGIRVFYSFVIGMLVYRSNWIIKSRLGFITMSFLLLLAFCFPYSGKTAWLTDTIIVVFYFPLIVALGAGASLKPGIAKICKFSGDISYPLYMVHYPFMWLFCSYMEVMKPSMSQMVFITVIGTLMLVGFAYLIMTFMDIPFRQLLKNGLKRRKVRV